MRFVNDVIQSEGSHTPVIALNDYRPINVTLIRPDDEIDVQLDSFRSQDIAAMINTGEFIARREMSLGIDASHDDVPITGASFTITP